MCIRDRRGQHVIDPAHWAELPDGHTRATTVETTSAPSHATTRPADLEPDGQPAPAVRAEARPGLVVAVVHRPLTDYDALAGLAPPSAAAHPAAQEATLVGAA